MTQFTAYDDNGRLLKSIGPNGVESVFSYNPRGWLTSVTSTPPNVAENGPARTTSYDYDNAGQLIKVTYPDNSEIRYEYDAAHELRAITDNLENRVEVTYDSRGNPVTTIIKDQHGNLEQQIDRNYNHRNFVESINNAGSVSQLVNDAVGNLSSSIDPKQNPSTTHSYDGLHRLTQTLDALGNPTALEYNINDRLTKVIAPNSAMTIYEYDDLGNQTKEISPDRGTLIYTHNTAGNVKSMLDDRGITVNYDYDALNRLTHISYPDISENVTYAFDGCTYGKGRLCQVDDASGTHVYSYDAWANVLSQQWQTSQTTLTTAYQYDVMNRVAQITYPSGTVVDIERDAIGRIKALYQPNSGPTEIIADGFQYRADGLVTSYRLGNNQLAEREYDVQSRLKKQKLDALEVSRYDYDPNSNITKRTDADQHRDYGYDALDRLNSDQHLSGIDGLDWVFTYDANGNRLSQDTNQSFETLAYSPDSNRLTEINNQALNPDPTGRGCVKT